MVRRCIMCFPFCQVNGEPLYLMLKRNFYLGGYWQPVSGFIDEPETNRTAALRELFEETGIEVYKRVIDPKIFYFFFMGNEKCSISVLAVELYEQPEIKISNEHTKYKWLFYEEARKILYWQNNRETLDKLHEFLLSKS